MPAGLFFVRIALLDMFNTHENRNTSRPSLWLMALSHSQTHQELETATVVGNEPPATDSIRDTNLPAAQRFKDFRPNMGHCHADTTLACRPCGGWRRGGGRRGATDATTQHQICLSIYLPTYKGWIYHASRGFFMHRTASACGNQDSSQSVCFIVSSKLAVRPASSWRMPSIPVKAAKSFSSNFLDRVLAKSSVCMGNVWF